MLKATAFISMTPLEIGVSIIHIEPVDLEIKAFPLI